VRFKGNLGNGSAPQNLPVGISLLMFGLRVDLGWSNLSRLFKIQT